MAWKILFSCFFKWKMSWLPFNPMQNPTTPNAVQSTGNDRVKPNITQEKVSGSVTNIIALRRPILSHNGPLSKLPIGWAIWENAAENGTKCHFFELKTEAIQLKGNSIENGELEHTAHYFVTRNVSNLRSGRNNDVFNRTLDIIPILTQPRSFSGWNGDVLIWI